MSSYLKNVSSVVRKNYQDDMAKALPSGEVEMEETPKATRKPRGTSPYVQVKVRRDIYETLGAVAKANSMTSGQVVESILESHLEAAKEALNSLRLQRNF